MDRKYHFQHCLKDQRMPVVWACNLLATCNSTDIGFMDSFVGQYYGFLRYKMVLAALKTPLFQRFDSLRGRKTYI